jgi:predicted enzyme related to lactoylglutathione lyase
MTTRGAFFHVTLRTLDVAAARDFYATVLGVSGAVLDVVPLHEAAIARGARPHWLSFLDVGDVESAAAAFVRRGATAMGPRWVNPQGLEAAVMRDPGGALLALARPPPVPRPGGSGLDVVRYVLHTPDVEAAKRNYAGEFGWRFEEPVELAGFVLHPFAWGAGGPVVGALGDIANRPEVHPHWLLQLGVAALDPAVQAVKAAAGLVATELTLPTGERLALCDDPQGAAFSLRELPRPPRGEEASNPRSGRRTGSF